MRIDGAPTSDADSKTSPVRVGGGEGRGGCGAHDAGLTRLPCTQQHHRSLLPVLLSPSFMLDGSAFHMCKSLDRSRIERPAVPSPPAPSPARSR